MQPRANSVKICRSWNQHAEDLLWQKGCCFQRVQMEASVYYEAAVVAYYRRNIIENIYFLEMIIELVQAHCRITVLEIPEFEPAVANLSIRKHKN